MNPFRPLVKTVFKKLSKENGNDLFGIHGEIFITLGYCWVFGFIHVRFN